MAEKATEPEDELTKAKAEAKAHELSAQTARDRVAALEDQVKPLPELLERVATLTDLLEAMTEELKSATERANKAEAAAAHIRQTLANYLLGEDAGQQVMRELRIIALRGSIEAEQAELNRLTEPT